jgi:hypothetical protein
MNANEKNVKVKNLNHRDRRENPEDTIRVSSRSFAAQSPFLVLFIFAVEIQPEVGL